MGQFKHNVEDGVHALDRIIGPEWRDTVKSAIEEGELELQSPSHCVLGHVYGDYWSGGREVLEKINGRKVPMSQDAMAELGFDLPSPLREENDAVEAYEELTREWEMYLCDQ